jgi:hypothetical protein
MLTPDRGNTIVGAMNQWRVTADQVTASTANFYTFDTQGALYALEIDTQADSNGNYPVGLKKI